MEIPEALATRDRRQLLTSYPVSQCCFPCMWTVSEETCSGLPFTSNHCVWSAFSTIPSEPFPLRPTRVQFRHHWLAMSPGGPNLLPQTSVARHAHHISLWTSCPKCLHRHSTVDLPSLSLAFHTIPSLKSKVLYNPFQKNRFLVLIPIKLTSRLLKNNQ